MLANINDLEELVSIDMMGDLDKWILSIAKSKFDEVHKLFSNYNFVNGMNVLNNFIVNELSGMYIDMTKDNLYCNEKSSLRRRSSQSAMTMIAKTMLMLVAPILTYTADEIIENAPVILKQNYEDIFDLEYESLPSVEAPFDSEYLEKAREGFGAFVDTLKKDKTIKSTLELIIYTESKQVLEMKKIDAEDWFVISGVFEDKPEENELGSFKVGSDTFTVAKATDFKCPRCWKFQAKSEECTCQRCASVINA